MHASLLFFLLLLLPGYVLLRYLAKDDLRSGLLGVVGVSWLLTLALLSPVSILCYVLAAPLGVFTGACVLAVVAAAVEVTRRAWWGEIGRLVVGGLCVEALIVATDMVLGSRVGAITEGDAVVHLTKIRFLLDHGFNNLDPFVSGNHFSPIYHTNLLHALYAACSSLTGIHHLSTWFASLPFAKLLIASGAYYMTWCVFDRRWPAWVAAVFTVACQGPITFAVYPNKLAPLWLAAMMIGFTVQACGRGASWREPLKLAAGSLVLGQLHALYGAFAGVVLAPALVVALGVRIVRREKAPWWPGVGVVALSAALPFLLIARSGMTPTSTSAPPVAITSAASADGTDASIDVPQRVTMAPRAGWGTVHDWRAAWLAVGVACAAIGTRRKQAAWFLAVAGVAALILYVPWLTAAAMGVFQKKWILSRLGFVLYLGFVVLVPASIACLIEAKLRFWWVRSLVSVGTAALLIWMPISRSQPPFTWTDYVSTARKPADQRHRYITNTSVVDGFCKQHIPPGATVLIEPWPGMVLTMNHDCYIVAPQTGSNGVDDLSTRRRDLNIMLSAKTPWAIRRELLRKYDVTHFFPAASSMAWARRHSKKVYPFDRRTGLFVLDTD